MNQVFSKFKNSPVLFTKHARKRILERFKLYMTQAERNDVEFFLRKDFSKAKVNFASYMSPFYKNKMEVLYGKNSFIASTEYLNYYGKYDEVQQILVIQTIYVKRKDYKK